MKKTVLALIFGTLACTLAMAQTSPITTVYHENFDAPSGPDSVTTFNTNTTLTSAWNDTNNLQVSPQMSYHTRVVPFDSVIFETTSFSTLNNVFVRLKFNQICKIHAAQQGIIQVSNDNGATWVTLDSAMYQGNSPGFQSTEYFNETSYPTQNLSPFWHGPTTSQANAVNPDNTWWSEETFDVSSVLGGTNGYANCKVRFIARHVANVPISLSGWYVDNILVEAAPCELEPPTFSYATIPVRKPVGARYTPSQDLNIKAADAQSGIDSVVLFYRINGGPWIDSLITPQASQACPDSSEFNFTWNNIALFDTIDWYVEIYDCACPNLTRDPIQNLQPKNYYTFWRDVAPPLICGQALPNSFPLVVATFPYVEDFENTSYWGAGSGSGQSGTSHRGSWPTDNTPNGLSWKVNPNDVSPGYAWSIRGNNTGTATSNTGPDNNNTPGGSQYVYIEASQGNGSGVPVLTQMVTPCIDLTGLNCAAMEFYYHMYGANIDRLLIDIDTGTASPVYTPVYHKIVGQQHANSGMPYTKAYISLDEFVGKIIRIRFTGRKKTATNQDKGDIAIDDIRIFEPIPVDVEMVNYTAPQNGYCGYSNGEEIFGKLQSLGCQTLTSVPIGYKIEYTDQNNVTTTSVTRDTLLGNYPLSKDTAFSFAPLANLSGYGDYKIWIFSDVPGDTIPTNDTVGPYIINHVEPFATFPHILDFDGSNTTAGDGTNNNPGVTGTDVWSRVPDPTVSSGYAFLVKEEATPSGFTGPRTDYSKNGNYMYAEGNNGSTPDNALFQSKCIDLGGLSNPVIDFMYHVYGSDIGNLSIQIVPNGSNVWQLLPNSLITPSASTQGNSKDQWMYHSVDLSAYANDVIKFRFVAYKNGAGSEADIALDNIRIYDKISTDVGILDITYPKKRTDSTALLAPSFKIHNFGTNSVSNITVTYTITPKCGPNAGTATTYTSTYSGTIAAGATYTYTVPASAMPNYPSTGDFEMCATTNQSGDTYAWNDSYCITSTGWPIVYIQNGFEEDFDSCNDGVYSGFWTNGKDDTFRHSDQEFSSSPNSIENITFPYNSYPNTDEYIFAPRFTGFDTIVGAELWFSHKFQLGSSDVGVLEYQTQNGWEPLGFSDPDNQIGYNWYNGANLGAVNNGDGFVGNSTSLANPTNGWVTSMWPLNIYNESSNDLVLRWHQINAGGGSVGWAIDNIEIRIPPQNSASPYAIDTEEHFLMPGQPARMKVRVQNTGAKTLKECAISYSVDGGPFTAPQTVIINNNGILSNQITDWIEFNDLWQNPTSGTHTICVVTSRPNDKQDNFPIDDTLCVEMKVFDEVDVNANNPSYCNNFDDPSQVEWVQLNTDVKYGLVSWEHGVPNQAPIVGAHSAPNAWMTKLDNNYKTRDSSSLYTPVFVVDSGDVFKVSFWHNYKTEKYHDGGTVDVTFDGGLSWRTVGYVKPDSSWYITDFVTSLDILNPGWSGESQGWEKDSINIQFDRDRKFVLRFRFASDQSFEYQGWAIDDFCIEVTQNSADDFIGIDDNRATEALNVGNVIPNPTNGTTSIPYYMDAPFDVSVTIYNTLGQQINSFVNQSQTGVNQIEFDVTGWAAGLYIVSLEVDGKQVTRKMMVK